MTARTWANFTGDRSEARGHGAAKWLRAPDGFAARQRQVSQAIF